MQSGLLSLLPPKFLVTHHSILALLHCFNFPLVPCRCYDKRDLVPLNNPVVCQSAGNKLHLNSNKCCSVDLCNNETLPILASPPSALGESIFGHDFANTFHIFLYNLSLPLHELNLTKLIPTNLMHHRLVSTNA